MRFIDESDFVNKGNGFTLRDCSGWKLQYSSQILKHLCDFPLPNVDLGFAVISELQNTRGSTLGKERGAFD